MTIFAVIATNQQEKLGAAIAKIYPENHIRINAESWLVSSEGTSNELSDKLGVTDGSNGSAVVLSVSGYYGRAPTSIWEWMKAKWGTGKDG